MKKSLFAFAAIAAIVAGCAQEIAAPDVPVNPVTPEEPNPVAEVVILKANVGEPETKVSIDGYKAFAWQTGDAISVLSSDGDPTQFTTTGNGTSVDFTGTFASGTLGKYAMYPASTSHTALDDDVNFNLPGTLTWSADGTNMPMLGKISAGVGTFKAVGGVLKLICYNIPSTATSLWFTSAATKIHGDFEIADATVDSPVIVTEDATDDQIAIEFDGNYSANMVFYIPLPTGTINGFTVAFYDDELNELFSKSTVASFTVSRNQMTIGPALNCATATTLWSEDFSGFSADQVPGIDGDGSGYGGATVTYTSTDGGGATKIYDDVLAGGTTPELLVGKNSGTFVASGIPTNGASSMTLTFKSNNTLGVTATSGITVGDVDSGSGEKTVTLTNAGSLDTFTLTFTNSSTSKNARLDDILVVIPATSATTPTITTGITNMNFTVGTLSKYTTVSLTNAVDGLGLSYELSGTDYSWVESVVIADGKITVNAVGSNTNADANAATLTIKATGASKALNLTQASALVQKPSSISTVPGDGTITAQWTKADHATGYKAYLCESSGLADPTDGTELTPSLDGSTYSVTKDGLTNGTEYYLYVKVNAVDDNYIAENAYTEVAVTPANVVYYEKVTAVGDIESGGKYLIVHETSSVAFNGGIASTSYDVTGNTIDVAIANSKIVANSTTNAASFTISGSTGSWYILSNAGYYVYRSTSSNGLDAASSVDADYVNAITFSDENVVISNSASGSAMYMRFNTAAGQLRFRYFTSETSCAAIQLYKYNDPRTAAGLEWRKSDASTSTDTATMLTGDDTLPTATLYNPNSLAGITYSSSDTGVATIGESTGTITLVAAGETVISATFPDGDASYKPQTVSYTLTVTDSRTTCSIPTFSPVAGAVAANTEVTISSATTGATIYYTTDGSTPTAESSHGTVGTPSATVTIDAAKTIKAIAVKDDYATSDVASATYTVSGVATELSAPSSLTITAISATGFTATWTNDVNASSYSWMLSTASSAPASTSDASVVSYGTSSDAELSSSTWTLTKSGLTLSGKYYLYVKAVGDGASYSDSGYSSVNKGIITLTMTNLGVTSSYSEMPTATIEGVGFKSEGVMKSNGNIQGKSKSMYIYNTSSLGKIKSIVVTQSGTRRAETMYIGDVSKPTTSTLTGSTSSLVTTYTFSSDKSYFNLYNGSSNAMYIVSIVIVYED